jgi:hypothetical protein
MYSREGCMGIMKFLVLTLAQGFDSAKWLFPSFNIDKERTYRFVTGYH